MSSNLISSHDRQDLPSYATSMACWSTYLDSREMSDTLENGLDYLKLAQTKSSGHVVRTETTY